MTLRFIKHAVLLIIFLKFLQNTGGSVFKTKSCEKDFLKDKAHGHSMVDAVLHKIKETHIFPEDKGFTRRVAWVETKFGKDSNTFRTKGGIWQITQADFEKTQQSRQLLPKKVAIKQKLNIDYDDISYRGGELRKPMVSAVAFKMLLQMKPKDIPLSMRGQGAFWRRHFTGDEGEGSIEKFVSDARSIPAQKSQTPVGCFAPMIEDR